VAPPVISAEIPLVSYIVLTRDRRVELSRCLASIERQDWSRREILVVDNASTDGTAGWVRAHHPDVRILVQAVNTGAAGGRNRALAVASGEILITLDDDAELMNEDATRRAVERLRSDPALGVVAFKILDPATGIEERKSIPRVDKRRLDEDYETTYFCTAGCALARRALPPGEVFWERLEIYGEELDLAYRILQRGHRMVRANDVLVLHHETPRARPPVRFIYRMIRNRLPIALRSLPPPAVATTFLVWALRMALLSLEAQALHAYGQGLLHSLRDVRPALAVRERLSADVIARLRRHAGRLWW
jgi:GT2 family glycosyltransferase